jgi:hypothetical protein
LGYPVAALVTSVWTFARECSVMQRRIHNDKNKGFEGGQYARSEEELYKKAIELLEKCKIEPRR